MNNEPFNATQEQKVIIDGKPFKKIEAIDVSCIDNSTTDTIDTFGIEDGLDYGDSC